MNRSRHNFRLPSRASRPLRVAVIVLALATLPFATEAQDLAPDKYAELTLKVLSHDQTLQGRVAGSIKIAIVSSASNADQAQSLIGAFEKRRGRQVKGMFIETTLVDLDAEGALDKAFSDKLTCLVVFGDVGVDLEPLSELTRRNGVLSMGSRKEHLSQLSLGLVAEGKRVKTYRSDAALRAERIKLDATFLNIARPL